MGTLGYLDWCKTGRKWAESGQNILWVGFLKSFQKSLKNGAGAGKAPKRGWPSLA